MVMDIPVHVKEKEPLPGEAGGPRTLGGWRSNLLIHGEDCRTIRIYLFVIFLAAGVIPIVVMLETGRSVIVVGAILGSTFILQAGAVSLVPLSSYPLADLLVIALIGLAFILAEFLIIDTLSYLPRIKRWIGRISEKAKGNRFIDRYGIYMLVPLVWTPGIGLYGGVGIAWLLKFDRFRSVLLLFLAWSVACLVVWLVMNGILAPLLRGSFT